MRTLATRIISILLLATTLAPFPYVLLMPEYAFAQQPPNTTTGGATSINTWGQAAASGAVSLAGCIAAGGLVMGGAAGGILGAVGGASSRQAHSSAARSIEYSAMRQFRVSSPRASLRVTSSSRVAAVSAQ